MTTYYWLNSDKQEWFDNRFNFRFDKYMAKGNKTEQEAATKAKRFALKQVGVEGDNETLDAMKPIEIEKWVIDKNIDPDAEYLVIDIEKETEKAVLIKTAQYANSHWIPKSTIIFK